MTINNLNVITISLMLLLFLGTAHAHSVKCKNKEYSCCRVDYAVQLEDSVKARMEQGRLVLMEGSGCPAMYVTEGGKPKFLLHQSGKCSGVDTPIVVNPSNNPNTWDIRGNPGSCVTAGKS